MTHAVATQVYDQLRARYCSPPRPGQRLPTEHELVRQFAVSRPTVRAAMERLVNEGLLERFPGKGTFVVDPNSRLVPSRVRELTVALFCRTLKTAEGADWATAAMDRLYEHGAAALTNVTHGDAFRELELLEQAAARRVDGIILHPNAMPAPSPTLRRKIAQLNIGQDTPVVVLADDSHYPCASTVWVDECKAGVLATQHLVEAGHRRIAHVSHQGRPHLAQRSAGYHRALELAGIAPRSEYLLDISAVPHSDRTVQMGRNAAKILLSLPKPPTAIFAYWTEVAAGILMEALDRGLRVPDDLAIIGMDAGMEEPTRSSLPMPISHIWIDMARIGRGAVDELLARIATGSPRRQVMHDVELRLGATTQRAPAGR
jgi:DNA-binding LacI/PurR family transcriptional regulator